MVRLILAFLPSTDRRIDQTRHFTFLKLKGGGSLIIALPALLAMRRAAPAAQFTLVCTNETKIYAELMGVFDNYAVIRDASPLTLIRSACKALKNCRRADFCFDLEPNSLLAAVFCLLSMAQRRLGFVKPEESHRRMAYTDAIAFNIHAPIYIYYDQLTAFVHAKPVTMLECRDNFLQTNITEAPHPNSIKRIGIAAFTSDFAPQRMMPDSIWAKLLCQYSKEKQQSMPFEIILFGSSANSAKAEKLARELGQALPGMTISNRCGQLRMQEVVAEMRFMDEFWSVDSGLLHIARLLGVECKSFWGPTNPRQRLRPIDNLAETASYRNFVCSPCAHLVGKLPCDGNNLCMKTMADANPDCAPLWLV